MDLTSLVPMLKSQGVKDFEGYGIKLSFHASESQVQTSLISDIPESTPTGSTASVTDQPKAPSDAGPSTDDTMTADQILNWSVGGDPMPLTGETTESA